MKLRLLGGLNEFTVGSVWAKHSLRHVTQKTSAVFIAVMVTQASWPKVRVSCPNSSTDQPLHGCSIPFPSPPKPGEESASPQLMKPKIYIRYISRSC